KGPFGTVLKNIIDVDIPMEMSKDGTIININTSGIKNKQIASIIDQLKARGFGAGSVFLLLPENPKKGKTWTETTDLGGIEITSKYTITKVENNTVELEVSQDMDIDQTIEKRGVQTESHYKGNSTVKMTVNK